MKQTPTLLAASTSSQSLARWTRLSLALACTAWLVACGGGGSDGQSTATANARRAEVLPTADVEAAVDTAAAAPPALSCHAGEPQWGEPNAVYTAKGDFLGTFAPTQFAVSDNGDAHVTWLSRHNGITDVWVRQYSAAENRWLEGSILVTVLDSDEGRITNARVTVAGTDVVVAWDFGVVSYSRGRSSPIYFFTGLYSPARLYYSRRIQGEGAWSKAQQVPGVMQRPIGRFTGWELTPAGPHKMVLVWYSTDRQALASFYSPDADTWTASQTLWTDTSENQYPLVAKFNAQGNGIVGFGSNGEDKKASVYFERTTGFWHQTPLSLDETPTIDESGNVYSIDRPWEGTSQRLDLNILSAATGQVTPRTVRPGFDNSLTILQAQLTLTTKGVLLSWIEQQRNADWSNTTLRRELEVSASGEPLGDIKTLPPELNRDVNSLQVSSRSASQLAVWSGTSCLTVTDCRSGVFTNVRDLDGNWSPPRSLTRPWGDSTLSLKVNLQGQGLLIQTTPDARSTYEERVFATTVR